MTAKQPPAKPVRPRSQPMRLWCVEYEHAGKVMVTTIEALTTALALERFDMGYPNVKVVRVY